MRLRHIPAYHVLIFAVVLCLCWLLPQTAVISGPSSSHLLTELQPDNVTTIQLYLRGDEHHFYYQGVNGYAIVRDDDGWLVYWNGTEDDVTERAQYQAVPPKVARKNSGRRRSRAGCDDPAKFGIAPGQIPRPDSTKYDEDTHNHDFSKRRRRIRRLRRQRRPRRRLTTDYKYTDDEVRTTGRFTNLVILLRFAGSRQTKATLPTRQQISTLMNSPMPDPDIYVPQLGCAQPKYSHTTIPHFLFATDAAERIQRWRNLSDDQG